MKQAPLKILPLLPMLLGVALVTLILWMPLHDTDFWWHLRLGNSMLNGNGIPKTELYSFTVAGRKFVDFYWLSEIVIAFLYKILHPVFLSLFFALIGAATLLIRLYQKNFTWRSSYVMLSLATAFMLAFGVRPLVFSWFFFVLLLWLLDRLERLSALQVIVSGFFLFLVWANMHNGWVLPLGYLLFLFSLHWFFWLLRWLQQPWAPQPFLSTREFRKLTTLIFVSVSATLINPYGIALWKTLIHEGMSMQNKAMISEWQALTIRHQLGLIFFALALYTFCAAATRKLWQPHQWIIYTFFFIIGAAGAVHAPFFLLLIAPYTAKALQTITIPKNLIFYAKLYIFPLTILGCVLIAFFQWYEVRNIPFWSGEGFPHKAAVAVKNLQLGKNVFNDYAWGGYIGYHLPQYNIFIDGRMSSWKRSEGYLLEDQITIETLKPGFERVLARYNPDWFFIQSQIPLAQWLKTNPGYKTVYEDEVAIVIVRQQ